MEIDSYEPIDCSMHDRLEDLATRGRVVRLRYQLDGETIEVDDTIVDWFTRNGAEFMRAGSGAEIRLDQILEIDGVRYR